MAFVGEILFAFSATIMLGRAVFLFQQNRVSSICFAALAGYAVVSVASSASLIEDFGEARYVDASLIYIVGCICLAGFSWLFVELLGAGKSLALSWSEADFSRHARYSAIFGVGSLLLLAAARESLLVNWNEARNDSGPITVLAAFSLLLAAPGIVSAWFDRRLGLTLFLVAICAISFAMLGSRAAMLGALVFGIWVMLTRAQGTPSKLRIVFYALILGFAMHVLFRQIRGLGVVGLLQAVEDGRLLMALFDSNTLMDPSGGEGEIPKYFVFATTVSSTQDFGFMSSIQRLFMLPIPRDNVWIDKPMDVTYLLWERAYVAGIFSEAEGQALLFESFASGSLGSLHPTLFGELFIAGGWVALIGSLVVLAAVFTFIDSSLDRMDRLTALALVGPILIGYLFVARGNTVIGLGYFFYLFIIFWIFRVSIELFSRGLRPTVLFYRSYIDKC